MPKASKYPKLRVYVKRGKSGQVWTSYAYDMRGAGKPDLPLGNDYDAALRPVFGSARWEEVTLPLLAEYVRKRTAKARARQEMQLLSVIWGYARLQGRTTLPYPAIGMQRSAWKGLARVRDIEVSDAAFDALYKHGDQTLRDALDIMTATGLRIEDVLKLPLSDSLSILAGKTGKEASFDLAVSTVLPPIIERRKAMRGPEHLFLLAAGRKPVTHRMLEARFTKARAKAAAEHPACAGLFLRDMRKRASQLAPSLVAASELLQHSSLSVTKRHYRTGGETLKPVR